MHDLCQRRRWSVDNRCSSVQRNLAALTSAIHTAVPMKLTIIELVLGAAAERAQSSETVEESPENENMKNVLKFLTPTRPTSRSVCENGVRPCPYVSCRYNLYLDVRGDGVLRLNFPQLEPDEMIASCALDMADDGPRTLEQIASLMGMSKERARQIEAAGLEKIKEALGVAELSDEEDF